MQVFNAVINDHDDNEANMQLCMDEHDANEAEIATLKAEVARVTAERDDAIRSCEEARQSLETSHQQAMEPHGPPPPLELVMCMHDGTELPQSEWESSFATVFSDGFWAKITRDNDTIIKFGECPYTIQDIVHSKTETPETEILTNLSSLMKYGANFNEHKEIGNKVIYKFFIEELMKCRRDTKGYTTIYEVMEDPSLKKAVWAETCRANRREKDGIPYAVDLYEYHRGAKGCVSIFRPSMAKYIYKKYGATSVLDPCA